MAAFEPAPDDWTADQATQLGDASSNGAGPSADGVGEGESAASA
jgi:hypothetical protein